MPDIKPIKSFEPRQNSDTDLFTPVFPLGLFILPRGRQRLRIFEAKYTSMIANISQGDGFIIARYDPELPFDVPSWGTRVEIVDFNIGDDGLLMVDVEGTGLVSIEGFKYQPDGLLLARTQPREHWSMVDADKPQDLLADTLKKLFCEHQHLAELYPVHHLNQAGWICARLIEILPIPLKDKERFIDPQSLKALETFLTDLLKVE